MTEFALQLPRVAPTQIKPGINPRTEFDAEKLAELAQSLKDDGGALQPVVVYLDDADGMYGLIAGERRWRASIEAGLESIEIIVRPKPTSAAAARKMALKENMQREDLTPLEIARAVQEMLSEEDAVGVPIYSKVRLADELGVHKSFIARCEALLHCSLRLQQRVHQRKTSLDIAAMIGAQPPDMHEWLEAEIIYRDKPMTVVEAREFIAEKVRRDLRKGQFNQDDDKLVEGKPACHACEFWGGNRPDVTGKSKTSVCLNPVCFDLKQRAFIEQTTAHASDGDGVRMLGQEQAEKIFSFDGVTVKGDSGYVAADEHPDKIMLVNPKTKVGKWEECLEGSEIAAVKILDGTGRLRTLYDARLAVQAVTAPDSAVRAIFKAGAVSVKGVTTSAKKDDGEAAKDKARATGTLVAGQNWMTRIRECADPEGSLREITRLIYERLTEPADRDWMGKVLGVKNPLDYGEGKATAGVLGLALVARTLRLQGPASINGIAGELAKLIGYDPKKEARDIADLVAAAGRTEKKGKEAKDPSPLAEKPLIAERIQGTTDDPGKFIAELLSMQVPETAPNKHGVYVAPPAYELKVKHLRLTICLACKAGASAEDDQWATGYHYGGNRKGQHGDGGALPSDGQFFGTRELALVNELDALITHLHKAEGYEPLVDAMRQALAQIPAREKLVPANADPEVEAFAKENGMVLMKPAKRTAAPRVADPATEAKALAHYLEHGSIKEAAEHAGVTVNTIKKWHQRRDWKGQREAHIKGKK